MGVKDQNITDRWAIYNGDSMEVMPHIPGDSIHLTIYSPPFAGLYQYSSQDRDLSNVRNPAEFFEHYRFFVEEIQRITMPGRISAVHCMDMPRSNTGRGDSLQDFPGDIIRLHNELGFDYVARYHVWKEPLAVRNRTMMKALAHKTIVEDSTKCAVASADYLLCFRKRGENPVPVEHPVGLLEYAGSRPMPAELQSFKGHTGKQTENRYSHWIWRQYASAFWDDVRIDRVLPFRAARDDEDERHVHPLQLDVIDRALVLWSNPGEKVLTPFMGVGSEVYSAVKAGRVGIGIELKESYYRQAVANLEAIDTDSVALSMFDEPAVEVTA